MLQRQEGQRGRLVKRWYEGGWEGQAAGRQEAEREGRQACRSSIGRLRQGTEGRRRGRKGEGVVGERDGMAAGVGGRKEEDRGEGRQVKKAGCCQQVEGQMQ